MDSKNNILSLVKGIAIILVVYGHVIQRNFVIQGEDFFMNSLFQFIYSFHMPIFVLISGYLLANSLVKKNYTEVFKLRVAGLLIPFICWAVIGLIRNYAMHLPNGPFMVDSVLWVWFLWVLFVLSALLILSYCLECLFGIWGYVVVSALVMLCPWHEFSGFYYVQWFYPFYVVGFCLNRRPVFMKAEWQSIKVFIIVAVLFLLLSRGWSKQDFIYVNHMHVNDLGEFFRLGYRYIVGFLGIAFTFFIAKALMQTKVRDILVTVGIYSLDIYLIQRFVVEGFYPRLIGQVSWTFDMNGILFNACVVPLIVIISIGICMGLSKLLLRSNQLLSRLLLGSRS